MATENEWDWTSPGGLEMESQTDDEDDILGKSS